MVPTLVPFVTRTAINTEPTEPEFGESRTYYPILATGGNDFSLRVNQIQPCKTW